MVTLLLVVISRSGCRLHKRSQRMITEVGAKKVAGTLELGPDRRRKVSDPVGCVRPINFRRLIMGKYADSLSDWKRGMREYRKARTQVDKHATDRKIREAFDHMVDAVLDEDSWDDEDHQAWDDEHGGERDE